MVWKTVEAASKNPDILDLPENTVQPTGTIKVAGAQTGDLAMDGAAPEPADPQGQPDGAVRHEGQAEADGGR